MYATIFDNPNWNLKHYDGRRREFRGITRKEFEEAKKKNRDREVARFRLCHETKTKSQSFKEWIAYFSTIPYEYTGDGFDDFSHYQRPASNGIGYVDICPGERGNNNYVDEPHLVAALKRKYNAWKSNKQQHTMDIYHELTATDLMGAIVEWGSDPTLIEDEEIAESYADTINAASLRREITDEDEFAGAKKRLGFSNSKPRHIYSFVNGSEGTVCFAADWDYEI